MNLKGFLECLVPHDVHDVHESCDEEFNVTSIKYLKCSANVYQYVEAFYYVCMLKCLIKKLMLQKTYRKDQQESQIEDVKTTETATRNKEEMAALIIDENGMFTLDN